MKTQPEKQKLISIIVPVYNEQSVIETFLNTTLAVVSTLDIKVEIIVINDGSTDATWQILCDLSDQHDNIHLIKFSRNFGKEPALMAGMNHCHGDAAVFLDADLQHPPELLGEMINCWLAGETDIVDGVKSTDKHGSFFDKQSSLFFNQLFKSITGHDMSAASDYKLLDKKVITALKAGHDKNLFFRGTTTWMGFKHKKIQFDVDKRAAGNSKWSAISRLSLAITAITSFTSKPLHLMSVVGLTSFAFALLLGIQTLYMKLNGEAVEGFTTVIMLILFFGSMITLGLGIIGTYLSKIHDEVRGRPHYVIEELVHSNNIDER